MGSEEVHLPLVNYLTAQVAYFGPAVLCLLAALLALVAHRSAFWCRAGVALGMLGGFSGLTSAQFVAHLVGLSGYEGTHKEGAVGFYVALAGVALTLFGATLLWSRSAVSD